MSNIPPVTRILRPLAGANLSGNEWLVASAYTNFGVTKVEFEYQAHGTTATIIGRAVPFPYGWIEIWNTSTVPNGDYRLRSVATDSSGSVASSTPVAVTINN